MATLAEIIAASILKDEGADASIPPIDNGVAEIKQAETAQPTVDFLELPEEEESCNGKKYTHTGSPTNLQGTKGILTPNFLGNFIPSTEEEAALLDSYVARGYLKEVEPKEVE